MRSSRFGSNWLLPAVLSLFYGVCALPAVGQGVLPDNYLQLRRQFLPRPVSQDSSRFDALSFVTGILNNGLGLTGSSDIGSGTVVPAPGAGPVSDPVAAAARALGYTQQPGDSLIRAFQSAEGLAVDGVAGPVTISRLILRLEQRSSGAREPVAAPPTVCDRGFYDAGENCEAVPVPANARLAESGHWWVCDSGYRAVQDMCAAIPIPANAQLNRAGTGWECAPGFIYRAARCAPIRVPENGILNENGKDWVCRMGYRRLGNRCNIDPAYTPSDSLQAGEGN